MRRLLIMLCAGCLFGCMAQVTAESDCRLRLCVQVLGSGGPIPDDARASSGYLVWIDGQAKVLVDTGGGVFLRFGEAGAKLEDLDIIALTHLHTDHVADLPALLKGGYFIDRTRALRLAGPGGGGLFPSVTEFVQGLFNSKTGIFRYLDGYLTGRGLFLLELRQVNAKQLTPVFTQNYRVLAATVHHGSVPALAYVVEAHGKRIVFSGDMSGLNAGFAAQVAPVDLLVMDHAVPENTGRIARSLHATPSEIGVLANRMQVKKLLLSHRMARSLGREAETVREIRNNFSGQITFAEDLQQVQP